MDKNAKLRKDVGIKANVEQTTTEQIVERRNQAGLRTQAEQTIAAIENTAAVRLAQEQTTDFDKLLGETPLQRAATLPQHQQPKAGPTDAAPHQQAAQQQPKKDGPTDAPPQQKVAESKPPQHKMASPTARA
jgi:hypothetical protein